MQENDKRQIQVSSYLWEGWGVHRGFSGTSSFISLKKNTWGTWVAQSVKRLPVAQVMISGSWD